MILQLFPNRNHTLHSTTKLEQDLSNEFSPVSANNNEEVDDSPAFSFTLDADKELVRHAIGEAFAGNETGTVTGEPFTDWVLSHVPFASHKERVDTVRFVISFGFMEDMKSNSFQLCIQQEQQQKEDESERSSNKGTIASVASVQEYDPKKHQKTKGPFTKIRQQMEFFFATIQVMRKYKEPIPALMQSKEYKEEMKIFDQKTERWMNEVDDWHCKYGPDGKHWYVHMVGCCPAFQGQGKGKQLMIKLCEMADKMNQPMYLEAGERNRPFYEKFGFVVQGSEEFHDPLDASNTLVMHCMTRQPATK